MTFCSFNLKTKKNQNFEKMKITKDIIILQMCPKNHNHVFLIGTYSMQGRTATKRHGVTRKRNTESSCPRKKTDDMDIPVASRNGDRQ